MKQTYYSIVDGAAPKWRWGLYCGYRVKSLAEYRLKKCKAGRWPHAKIITYEA